MESQDKIQDLCKMQNAFQILGLAEGAGRAEIRRAYAKLSKIFPYSGESMAKTGNFRNFIIYFLKYSRGNDIL